MARARAYAVPALAAAALLAAGCEGAAPIDRPGLRAGVARVGVAFPPAGESLQTQPRQTPEEAGFHPDVVTALRRAIQRGRWALWRHGHLVHVEGSFNETREVKSAAKTLHGVLVGAAIEQGRIFSVDDDVAPFAPDLAGRGLTWRHLLTQTSGLSDPELAPGERWIYHESNPVVLCHALARVWGRASYWDGYAGVIGRALLDEIDAEGWSARAQQDGVRLVMDLEDLGRLGLLMVTGGVWRDRQVLPAGFLRDLATRQTHGVPPDYEAHPKPLQPNVRSGLRAEDFPEAPYGYLTWTNTERDLWPRASSTWAAAHGAGNHIVAWDPASGVVLAVLGGRFAPQADAPPGWPVPMRPALEAIDAHLAGPHPGVQPLPERLGALDRQALWQPFEIVLRGPRSTARGGPNPFGLRLDLELVAPRGERLRVPGFYAGDGEGGADGDVWKVRFAADEIGSWRFTTHSSSAALDALRGSFEVQPAPDDAPGFFGLGRLEAVGTARDRVRYLRFRDGPHWLKAGSDDPENFLGSARSYDTVEKRARAVDHLASRGVNSLYVMTHNVEGDDRDVWPWLGDTEQEAKVHASADVRFDLARLARWRQTFVHMQRRGVAIHMVLEDDQAWTGFDRPRYYREMVAHFGDLPALLFNLVEEYDERYTLDEALEKLRLLARIDPYGHPRGIHNVNEPEDAYLLAPHVDFASIQTKGGDPLEHHTLALAWLARSRALATRVPMIGFDEPRPLLDRRGWWAGFLAGSVWEAHVDAPYDRPIETWDQAWVELGGARAFLETLPFWAMEPRQDLVVAGRAFALASPGEAYAFYLPRGGSVAVSLAPGAYEAAWWDPANGRDGAFLPAGRVAGGLQRFDPPAAGDWALRILAAR